MPHMEAGRCPTSFFGVQVFLTRVGHEDLVIFLPL